MKTLFKCTVCNYVHEEIRTGFLPEMRRSKEKFEQLNQKQIKYSLRIIPMTSHGACPA